MHVTLVHVFVKQAHLTEFVEACHLNHVGSTAEPGNLRFDILQDAADPTHFVLYEAYVDESAAKAHKETAHYAAWRDRVADMMARPREGQPFVGLYPVV
ncbi:MAG: antibiotic biosynthesis monooxygenase [Chromatiaceae bacterium]|nr:antibiotic biosynthesis monooxygenase [Gammaproteobacteria bacterium]MCP5304438.1 antibiotic biosynthesis monooxygenase [Chromatiaceae bacterium]MCP5314166.1 antibiotic biosynthesis monooxygenase [Chromatiaceae bacterium]